MLVRSFLFTLLLTTLPFVYPDYHRNLARSTYWLLANNLYHLNSTQQRQFYLVVDNEHSTKKNLLLQLGKWVEDKGEYMVRQYERMINYERQLYRTFEEFQLELNHSDGANKLIQKLYEEHKNLDYTWKQTCRHKNQLIRLADKETVNELKLQLNSWCIPKPKPKKSGLLKGSKNESGEMGRSAVISHPTPTPQPTIETTPKEENRTALLIQALDFLGGMEGEDLEKIRRGGNQPTKTAPAPHPTPTPQPTIGTTPKEENRTALLIQALDFLGGMGGEDLEKIRRGG